MCVGFPKQDPLFLVYRQIYFTRSPVQCVFAKMYGVGVRLWTIWFLCHESSVQFHDMALCKSTQKWASAGNRDPLFALATCKQTALDTLEFALCAFLWTLGRYTLMPHKRGHHAIYTDDTFVIFVSLQIITTFSVFTLRGSGSCSKRRPTQDSSSNHRLRYGLIGDGCLVKSLYSRRRLNCWSPTCTYT